MAEHKSVSVETLQAITAAFNAHDLDAIMEFSAHATRRENLTSVAWRCTLGLRPQAKR